MRYTDDIKKAETDRINSNERAALKVIENEQLSWVKQNTAILVVHGIGNQLPLETLDQFSVGLVKKYSSDLLGIGDYIIEHRVEKKGDSGGEWFDNIIRIKKKDSPYFIDLYEYYWAHHTENKVTATEIRDWTVGVLKGADSYYKANVALAEKYENADAIRYNSSQVTLGYRFMIRVALGILIFWNVLKGWLKLLPFATFTPKNFLKSVTNDLANVIGDIVAYNVTDNKSKHYAVRRCILDGAVDSIKFLLEKETDNIMSYPSVVIAGHSLGSQVSYDAINRINFLINAGCIRNYESNGFCKNGSDVGISKIDQQLHGFISFGSPLDKIAFFLRENIPPEQFVRQQLLSDYLSFKQRDWTPAINKTMPYFTIANSASVRLLENVKWRNYHDENDYVSGSLDYYKGLTNIDCKFKTKSAIPFTHSNYWTCDAFYADIIREYLQ